MTESVDPRIERSRSLILESTLDELAAVGYGALAVEGIARRAGVGKATIYRHWNGKLDLVAEAVTTLKQAVHAPETDDHLERIEGYLRAVAASVADSRLSACLPALVEASERDEAVREFHHRSGAERRTTFVALLDSARDAGHIGADVDVDTSLLAECLVGPIMLRRLLTAEPYPPADVDRLIATVLAPWWRADPALP